MGGASQPCHLCSRSSGRAGKPVVKWTEVLSSNFPLTALTSILDGILLTLLSFPIFKIQSWFQKNQQQGREVSLDKSKKLHAAPETLTRNKATGNQKLPEGVFY